MQFDIDKFFDRLQEQALTKQQACQAVYNEIKDAESQKIAFVDQANENPEYFKFICNQIDSYIIYLKVLHNRIAPHNQEELDEQTFDTDKAVVYHTMKLLMQVDQLEKKKHTRPHTAVKFAKRDDTDADQQKQRHKQNRHLF